MRAPSVAIAFDADGNPTKVVAGFARGQGIEPSALIQRGGVYASVHEKGSETAQLLTKLLPELIRAISLPNSMPGVIWTSALSDRFVGLSHSTGRRLYPLRLQMSQVGTRHADIGRFLHRTSLFLCPQNMRRRVKRHKGGRCTDSEMNLVRLSTFFLFPSRQSRYFMLLYAR